MVSLVFEARKRRPSMVRRAGRASRGTRAGDRDVAAARAGAAAGSAGRPRRRSSRPSSICAQLQAEAAARPPGRSSSSHGADGRGLRPRCPPRRQVGVESAPGVLEVGHEGLDAGRGCEKLATIRPASGLLLERRAQELYCGRRRSASTLPVSSEDQGEVAGRGRPAPAVSGDGPLVVADLGGLAALQGIADLARAGAQVDVGGDEAGRRCPGPGTCRSTPPVISRSGGRKGLNRANGRSATVPEAFQGPVLAHCPWAQRRACCPRSSRNPAGRPAWCRRRGPPGRRGPGRRSARSARSSRRISPLQVVVAVEAAGQGEVEVPFRRRARRGPTSWAARVPRPSSVTVSNRLLAEPDAWRRRGRAGCCPLRGEVDVRRNGQRLDVVGAGRPGTRRSPGRAPAAPSRGRRGGLGRASEPPLSGRASARLGASSCQSRLPASALKVPAAVSRAEPERRSSRGRR